MKRGLMTGLAMAALSLVLPLAGTPARAEDPQSSFVRLHAIDLLENALAQDQVTTLQLVAHQAAIAAACDGFTLDDAKFAKVFERLAPKDAAKMSDAQKAYHDKHLLVAYGILVGGELAAMSQDVSGACAMAKDTKADPAMADELVWQ